MDCPLESDRVDDLNFFSIVSRAPVIGTIIWILGGSETARNHKDAALDGALPPPPPKTTNMKRSFSKRSALKKTAPSLTGSEVSELAEVGDSLAGMSLSSNTKLGSRKKELSWSDESGKDLVEVIQEVSQTTSLSLSIKVVLGAVDG